MASKPQHPPADGSDAPPLLAYAKPDVDADLRDDASGLLIRESLDNAVSWTVHGLLAAVLLVGPTLSSMRDGFPTDPRLGWIGWAWHLVGIVGLGALGLLVIIRPTNFREAYFDFGRG